MITQACSSITQKIGVLSTMHCTLDLIYKWPSVILYVDYVETCTFQLAVTSLILVFISQYNFYTKKTKRGSKGYLKCTEKNYEAAVIYEYELQKIVEPTCTVSQILRKIRPWQPVESLFAPNSNKVYIISLSSFPIVFHIMAVALNRIYAQNDIQYPGLKS